MYNIKIENISEKDIDRIISLLNTRALKYSVNLSKEPIDSKYVKIRDWLKLEPNKKVMKALFENPVNYENHYIETLVKFAKTMKIVHKLNGMFYVDANTTNIEYFAKRCREESKNKLSWMNIKDGD